MSGIGTADRTTEEEQGDLRRSLGFRDWTSSSTGCCSSPAPMAPVGVYGTLDAVATVAMAFTAFGYAEAGFVAGWTAMLDYLLIPAVAYLLSRHC